ncbi:MAG: type II toxin-antitoxin system VapC family toxin [Candidatus Sigynarchaeum springense]
MSLAAQTKGASPPVFYVDANIFLNPILYDVNVVPEAAAAAKFLMEVKAGHFKALTSVLTWDEVTWIVRKNVDIATARKKGQEFLMFPGLRFLPVTASIINKAQLLLEQHTIKPRDAIHLASGLANGVTAFVTLDDDFKGIPGITYRQP